MAEKKQLSIPELQGLLAAGEDLSIEDMQKIVVYEQMRKASMECEVVAKQVSDFQDQKADREARARHKTESIDAENAKTQAEQSTCRHATGGKGVAQFFFGDSKQGKCVAEQQLPTGERYFICFRCIREWHLPSKRAVLDGSMTLAEYRKQEREYWDVASWDRPLFQTDSGEVPGSVLFRIPKLEKQRALDDAEFEVFLTRHKEPSHANA